MQSYTLTVFYRALERISVPTSEFKDGDDPFDTETDEEREMRSVLLYQCISLLLLYTLHR